jgi:FkbM family methyltransferase
VISYSQNFEDVILGRVFKHVTNGFYIDIGAQDPIRDSTSKFFYDKGWTGIDVEPMPQYASKLRENRGRNTVIEKVVTQDLNDRDFYLVHDTGLSTTSAILASNYKAEGRFVEKVLVETISLDSILELVNGKEVHWLKIDVEGSEKSVITSWKDSKVRPWVLVIESTEPNSQVSTHLEWEEEIESKDYTYVYGDGLNRFYLHRDYEELRGAFVYPPNIFDEFELSGSGSQPFCRSLNSEIIDLKKLRQALNLEMQALQSTNQALNLEMQASQSTNQALNLEMQALQSANQALNLEMQALQSANQALNLEMQALQSANQALNLEIEGLKARFNLFRWVDVKLQNKFIRKVPFRIKILVLKLTQEMPWLQNQLRLLWRYGFRKRFGHFLFKIRAKKVTLELTSGSHHKVQNLSKNGDQNLISILQKKARNYENLI